MFVISLVALLGVASCSLSTTTTDKASDAAAAGNFLPKLDGYNVTSATSLKDAITSISGGAALLSGNLALTAVIAKVDAIITCYRNVGAVDANIYTEKTLDITNVKLPKAGMVAVINQNRLQNDFLPCLSGNAGFSAQDASIQPCVGSGNFQVYNETILYLYVATDQELCSAFDQWFTIVKSSVTPTK